MKVVILGGGFCGAVIAKKLNRYKELEVTLFDTKDYFEYSPSIWKLLLHPSYHRRLIIPYRQFLNRTRIITDIIRNVTPEYVETEKEKLVYEYLVVSTGIDYPVFLKNKENVFTIKSGTEVTQYSEKVAKATTILIIGGGLIGTEVAGALARSTPEKQIILVHPHDRLLERNTKAVSHYAKKYLEEHGVQLIFKEKVVDHRNGIFITDTQRRITADLGIWCAGITSNPWYLSTFLPSVFTEKKALKVNQFLQLEGYKNIFVGGDITSTPEEKTAASADRHGRIISENILRVLKQKSLIVYKPRKEPMVISLGNGDGILTYPPFVIPGFIPAILKLLVEKIGIKRLR
jgi:NADH dehydrogenase FAD-containing subunit